MLAALDQVPLDSICQFVLHTHRFADVYCNGLDGPQAAWAARKYKGHCMLPPSFKRDMLAAGNM
ncbi:hypothetical protein K438DRAFT_1637468 [Mycena galopus ATCC 62051]|nr:hypothetical protein K438DRAFT_1637468 [Mycena galopus ATCC 62051]